VLEHFETIHDSAQLVTRETSEVEARERERELIKKKRSWI